MQMCHSSPKIGLKSFIGNVILDGLSLFSIGDGQCFLKTLLKDSQLNGTSTFKYFKYPVLPFLAQFKRDMDLIKLYLKARSSFFSL